MPNLIVIMGVSACGKSSVAKALADRFGYHFVEADDFHSPENIKHMASGQPLTDRMREPWIDALKAHLQQAAVEQQDCVMSFSGLRRAHRDQIRTMPMRCLYIHLVGEQALIQERIDARTDHFMSSDLLSSQYAALESTDQEADVFCVNINQPLSAVINEAHAIAKQQLNINNENTHD